ncbi:NAD(P)-dependent glycerol-3-phosphate dehydrogenase [bacterium]|jgi:glycerol-3-phosphate dehydrogenase (NAD(P)+)|nr:NAD(P)-dependent glycerol-3-phosphate dehydrogenase [bacterium]
MRITVVGDGAMGTACALLLAKKSDLEVSLWCQFAENAEAMRRDRENRRFLPGISLPPSVSIESDVACCRDADAIILAVPMLYLRATLTRLVASGLSPRVGLPIVSVIKGIERETSARPSEIVKEFFPQSRLAALSGPMHAEELAQEMLASVVAASEDAPVAEMVQRWFSSDRLRVYTSRDLIGTELGGALKNVIAIAAGICDGANLGDNAKSALMTRGLVEMIRLGTVLGADPRTFYGLAGLGDLITTCVSPHGRNRRVGHRIGTGEKIHDILASMVQVSEGVWTSQSVYALAKDRGIDMPVTTEVYQILFEGEDVTQAITDLMQRPLSAE